MTTADEKKICVPAYKAGYRFEITDVEKSGFSEICVGCFEDNLKCSPESDRILCALIDYENDTARYAKFDREILENGIIRVNGRVKVKPDTSVFFRQQVVNSLMSASLSFIKRNADFISGRLTWEEVLSDGTAN